MRTKKDLEADLHRVEADLVRTEAARSRAELRIEALERKLAVHDGVTGTLLAERDRTIWNQRKELHNLGKAYARYRRRSRRELDEALGTCTELAERAELRLEDEVALKFRNMCLANENRTLTSLLNLTCDLVDELTQGNQQ